MFGLFNFCALGSTRLYPNTILTQAQTSKITKSHRLVVIGCLLHVLTFACAKIRKNVHDNDGKDGNVQPRERKRQRQPHTSLDVLTCVSLDDATVTTQRMSQSKSFHLSATSTSLRKASERKQQMPASYYWNTAFVTLAGNYVRNRSTPAWSC